MYLYHSFTVFLDIVNVLAPRLLGLYHYFKVSAVGDGGVVQQWWSVTQLVRYICDRFPIKEALIDIKSDTTEHFDRLSIN